MNQKQETLEQEVFVQTVKKDEVSIAIIVTDTPWSNAYIVNEYELIGDSPNPAIKKEFNSKSKIKNYYDFQKYVKDIAGTEAVFYDYDSCRAGAFCLNGFEKALRNHLDLS